MTPSITSSSSRTVFWVVFLLSVGWFLTGAYLMRGGLAHPPEGIDPFDYVHIAENLVKGRGFSLYYNEPGAFDDFHGRFNGDRYDDIRTYYGSAAQSGGPTLYRPPGYPALLALLFALFGKNLVLARLGNIVAMALAVSLSCCMAYRFAGRKGALLTAGLLWTDRQVSLFSFTLLSEAPAALLLTATVYGVLMIPPGKARDVALGVLLAGLASVKPQVLFWLPCLGLLYWVARRRDSSLSVRAGLLLFALPYLLALPWALRNSLVAGAFQPLPVSGQMSLSAAYCEESLALWGNCALEQLLRAIKEVHEEGSLEGVGHGRQEYLIGRRSVRNAREWMKQNPGKIPLLMVRRCCTHLSLVPRHSWFSLLNLVFVMAFGLGILINRDSPLTRVVGAIVLVNLLFVSFSFVAFGRYLLPLRPIMAAVAGSGLVRAGSLLVRTTRVRRQRAAA